MTPDTPDFAAINAKALEIARRATSSREGSASSDASDAEGANEAIEAPPGHVVFSAISGGHMYGFPSPDSDLDIRGCHVLPVAEVIGLSPSRETFEEMGKFFEGVEIDRVSHDLAKYLRLLLKNGGYILEQIFSPLVIEEDGTLGELRELARGVMTQHVLHHYDGFFRKKYEEVEESEELSAKSVLYLFRVVLSGIHLLETGEVETDLQRLAERSAVEYLPELWLLKSTDRESATLETGWRERVLTDAARLRESMHAAVARSPLPAEVPLAGRAALDDYLVRMRLTERTRGG